MMGIPENRVKGIKMTNPVNAAEKKDESVSTMLVDRLFIAFGMSEIVNIMI